MSKDIYEDSERYLKLTSFFGGENRGPMLQLTMGSDFVELSKAEVGKFVAAAVAWLNAATPGSTDHREQAKSAWSDWDDDDINHELRGYLPPQQGSPIEQPKAPTGNVDYPSAVVIKQPEAVQKLLIQAEATATRLNAEKERALYWLCRLGSVIDYVYEHGDPHDFQYAPVSASIDGASEFLTALGYDEARRKQMLDLGEPGKERKP